MQIRRCATLFIELRNDAVFDLAHLLAGGDGLRRRARWLALAPHLDAEVEVGTAEREWLGELSPARWRLIDQIQPPPAWLDGLIEQGLVISDQQEHAAHRHNDERCSSSAGGHWLRCGTASRVGKARTAWQRWRRKV